MVAGTVACGAVIVGTEIGGTIIVGAVTGGDAVGGLRPIALGSLSVANLVDANDKLATLDRLASKIRPIPTKTAQA
jgi:hypothetical protein